jgi:hypothetical protein
MVKAAVREEKPKISFFELSFRKKINLCPQKYPLFGQIFLKIRKVPESKSHKFALVFEMSMLFFSNK